MVIGGRQKGGQTRRVFLGCMCYTVGMVYALASLLGVWRIDEEGISGNTPSNIGSGRGLRQSCRRNAYSELFLHCGSFDTGMRDAGCCSKSRDRSE